MKRNSKTIRMLLYNNWCWARKFFLYMRIMKSQCKKPMMVILFLNLLHLSAFNIHSKHLWFFGMNVKRLENIILILAMDMFIKLSSILVDVGTLSRFGSVLANNGYCPFTDQVIFNKNTAKNTLSSLVLFGMNTMNGKFLRAYGLPVKSSITGGKCPM